MTKWKRNPNFNNEFVIPHNFHYYKKAINIVEYHNWWSINIYVKLKSNMHVAVGWWYCTLCGYEKFLIFGFPIDRYVEKRESFTTNVLYSVIPTSHLYSAFLVVVWTISFSLLQCHSHKATCGWINKVFFFTFFSSKRHLLLSDSEISI